MILLCAIWALLALCGVLTIAAGACHHPLPPWIVEAMREERRAAELCRDAKGRR
jgi:hypothetical protein